MTTPAEFYDMLARFDWYYAFSDDHGVWRRGERRWAELEQIAKTSPEHTAIKQAWCDYMNKVGDPARPPKPVRPS